MFNIVTFILTISSFVYSQETATETTGMKLKFFCNFTKQKYSTLLKLDTQPRIQNLPLMNTGLVDVSTSFGDYCQYINSASDPADAVAKMAAPEFCDSIQNLNSACVIMKENFLNSNNLDPSSFPVLDKGLKGVAEALIGISEATNTIISGETATPKSPNYLASLLKILAKLKFKLARTIKKFYGENGQNFAAACESLNLFGNMTRFGDAFHQLADTVGELESPIPRINAQVIKNLQKVGNAEYAMERAIRGLGA